MGLSLENRLGSFYFASEIAISCRVFKFVSLINNVKTKYDLKGKKNVMDSKIICMILTAVMIIPIVLGFLRK